MPSVHNSLCQTCGTWLDDDEIEAHLNANQTHVINENKRWVDVAEQKDDIEDVAQAPPDIANAALAGGGGLKYICGPSGSGAPYTSVQTMVTAMEADTLPQIGILLPGVYTENVTVTKPGVHLFGYTLGAYGTTLTEVTAIDGNLTYTLSGGTGQVCAFQGIMIDGILTVGGTQATLLWVNDVEARNGSVTPVVLSNTSGNSALVGDKFSANMTAGTAPALVMSGGMSIDAEDCQIARVGGTGGTAIELSAGGNGVILRDSRVSGRIVATGGTKNVNITGSVSTVVTDGASGSAIDLTAGTGTVYLSGPTLLGQAGVDVVEVADAPADFTYANVVAFAGDLNDTMGNPLDRVGTTQIDDEAVTLAKMAHITTDSFLGRDTAGTGDVEVLTATQVRTILNVADGANNYTHPNHTGDVTSTGDGATVIADEAVTLAKMAHMATDSFLGRTTASTGDVEVLTATQARAILNVEDGAAADQTAAEVAFTPDGDIAASDVQAAIEEVRDDTDTKLAGKAAVDHDATHIQGGADEIDGDQIDIDFTPSNYTPSTSPGEVDDLDQLSAHLAGIDDQLVDPGTLFFDGYNTAATALDAVAFPGAVAIPLNTERIKDSIYTHSAAAASVTVTETATYLVEYSFSTQLTAGASSDSEAALMLDTGGGFAEVAGTTAANHNSSSTTAGVNTAGGKATLSLNSGDILQVQGRIQDGTGSISTFPDGSSLRITRLALATTTTNDDSDAIHDNVSGEILAVTEKVAPVAADVLLIEDSEAGDTKKRVEIGNLPTGASLPVADTVSIVEGSVDATKEMRFEVDGLTTGTVRVVTMPDKDLTLDDQNDPRPPDAHSLGGAEHNADTLANLNSKVSDATLIDTGDSRLSDDRNDADAIHDNVAGEVAALSLVTVDGADHILIEDDSDSDNKKRVLASDLLAAGAAEAFSGYDQTGGTSLDAGWADIPILTERVKTSNIVHSASSAEVTINATGRYIIIGEATSNITAGTSRSQCQLKLQIDTGGGYGDVGGTLRGMYARQASQPQNSGSFTIILDLTSGDKIKMQAQRASGGSTCVTLADGQSLTLMTTTGQGVAGDTGADGADGSTLYQFAADQLIGTTAADWVVSATAALGGDGVEDNLQLRAFDDTTEEGVGFPLEIPAGTTSVKFRIRAKAVAAGGGDVIPKIYAQEINDNAAVSAWDSGTVMTALVYPTNSFAQYDEQTITLATLGWTADKLYWFELTRDAANGSDDLSSDWGLLQLGIEFIQ